MSRDTSDNRDCKKCGYYKPPYSDCINGHSYGHGICEHPRVVSKSKVMHNELARQQTERCGESGFYWTPGHRYK